MDQGFSWKFLAILSAISYIHAGTFWYFDDLHYDPTYGAANESCYPDTRNPSPKFNPKGSYFCDSPWALVEDAIVKMKGNMATPDFVVWAGDTGHHPLTKTTVLNDAVLFQAMQNVTIVLQREFPGIRVLPLLGNHDWLPKNQLPAQGTSGDFYEQYAKLFQQAGWLSQDEAEVFKKAGYFATTLPGAGEKVRVLVLNTNLYLLKNTATSGEDPAGQFKFMRDELEKAKQNNQVVSIFTHVPVGSNSMRSPYDETFIDIITDYSSVIQSMHAAHEHVDRFRLIYKQGEETPKAFQIITPAITPWIGGRPYPRNPSFASFLYNDIDFSLQDMSLYYLDLANNDARWVKLYSFRETYNSPINVGTLTNLLQKLKNDENFFNDYYRRMWVNIGSDFLKGCDENCRKSELCMIEYSRNNDLDRCLPTDNGSGSTTVHQVATSVITVALIWRIFLA